MKLKLLLMLLFGSVMTITAQSTGNGSCRLGSNSHDAAKQQHKQQFKFHLTN